VRVQDQKVSLTTKKIRGGLLVEKSRPKEMGETHRREHFWGCGFCVVVGGGGGGGGGGGFVLCGFVLYTRGKKTL